MTTSTSTPARDFSRQSSLVPEAILSITPVTVIGVGAVGRNVALQLAAIGAKSVILHDFDMVDASNITTQGYRAAELGAYKVNACAAAIRELDSEAAVWTNYERWRPGGGPVDGHGVFCCVDSMAARRAIHKGVKDRCAFFADARMMGETCYVYVASTPEEHEDYEATLFGDDEVESGRCTARSTIYCASFCAAAMVHQFARWLRGQATMNVGGSLLEFMPL